MNDLGPGELISTTAPIDIKQPQDYTMAMTPQDGAILADLKRRLEQAAAGLALSSARG
jgi:hypothetical protein